MLNYLWPIFIISSFIYAFLSGNIDNINNSIFESTKDAVELSFTLLGTMCLWNGIMEIAIKTSIIDKLTKVLKPIINYLFPEIKNEGKVNMEIAMNIIANILGLGNTATPTGLKVMESLQQLNPKKDTVSNTMAMFIVLNTASLQLIPTTVITIRTSLGSNNPTQIILPIWFSTACSIVVAVLFTKVLIKRSK